MCQRAPWYNRYIGEALMSHRLLGVLRQTVQHTKAREKGFHVRSILWPNSSLLLSY